MSILLYYLVNGIIRLSSRLFRMVMVSIRGWPPAHLDADGDVVKEDNLEPLRHWAKDAKSYNNE